MATAKPTDCVNELCVCFQIHFYYNRAEPPVRTGVCVGGRQEGREKEAKVFLFGLSALHGILSHNSCVSSIKFQFPLNVVSSSVG